MKFSTSSVVQFVVSALLGAGGSLLFVLVVDWPTLRDLDRSDVMPVLLVSFVAAWYLNVALHELGHYTAARLVNFRVLVAAIGPVCWTRRASGWTFGISRHSWLGGLVLGLPADSREFRRQFLAVVAGGPIVTSACAVASMLLLRQMTPAGGELAGSQATAFLAVAAATAASWFLLIICLAPSPGADLATDGAAFVAAWRHPETVLRTQALMSIGVASMAGVRPSAWDADQLRLAMSGAAEDPDSAFARVFAYWKALDGGDLATARQFLDDAIAKQGVMRNEAKRVLLQAAALHYAVYDGDTGAARRAIAAMPAGRLMADGYRTHLVEGAVRVVEGRPDAGVALDAAERLLADSIEPGFAAMDRDLLASLRARLGAATAA